MRLKPKIYQYPLPFHTIWVGRNGPVVEFMTHLVATAISLLVVPLKLSRWALKKKPCRTYLTYNEDGATIPPHNCNVNHEGSSGSMEGDLALELLQGIHRDTEQKVFVSHLVTDDDTTLHVNCSNKTGGN